MNRPLDAQTLQHQSFISLSTKLSSQSDFENQFFKIFIVFVLPVAWIDLTI